MHWMHLSFYTVHFFWSYRDVFLSVSLITFWPVLCETVWNILIFTPHLIVPILLWFFFFIQIKEMGHIKQKLRNSNNEKNEHFTGRYGAPVSALKILEVTSIVFVLLMSLFSALYIPQRNNNVMSLPAAYLVYLWTFPVMLKSPEEHRLYFLPKGRIFHEAGTFFFF